MKAYVPGLIVLGLQMSPLAAADKKETPEPLPPKIVQAWRDAGANVGWMDMNLYLNRPYFEVEPWRQFRSEGQGFGSVREGIPLEWYDRTSAIPVFQFSAWEDGVLMKLSDPGAPFGLCLNLTKVTDARLKELAGLKSLQALYLAGTPVTDAGLKELAGLKNLQTLDVRGTKVTDAGLKELAGLKSLQSLYLTGCPVTGVGLKELAGLKSLQVLNLGDTKMTGAGLKEVAELKSLQALYLYNTAVSDVDLKDFAELKSLQFLNLVQCSGVTDAGLKDLGALKSVKDLSITYTKVTAAGLAALRKDLPACHVH